MNVCRYFLSLSRKTLIVRKVWVSWLIFLLRRGVAHARPVVFEVPFEYLARRSIFPIMLPKYASSGRRRSSCRFRPLRCILAASKVTPWAPWGASRYKGSKPNSPPKSAPVVRRMRLGHAYITHPPNLNSTGVICLRGGKTVGPYAFWDRFKASKTNDNSYQPFFPKSSQPSAKETQFVFLWRQNTTPELPVPVLVRKPFTLEQDNEK